MHDEGNLRTMSAAPAASPVTGEETVVFSCARPSQPLDHVDFANLRARLRQNAVQEKLTKRWIELFGSRAALGDWLASDQPTNGISHERYL